MKQYFTMGQRHIHNGNGKVIDKDCVVCIEAPTEAEAREKAFEYFDGEFCFQYDEDKITKEFMSHFPRGIVNL